MALDDNPWKWSPVLLLSPLPWALVSVVISCGGMLVLNGAETYCQDPSLNAVDTSAMSTGIALGVISAYSFLGVYTWAWLGFSVQAIFPWRSQGEWIYRRIRVAKPFTQLKWVAYCYAAIAALSLCAGIITTAGAGSVGAVCAFQTPMLISFSTFSFLVYWIAFAITVGRLFALTKGAKLAGAFGKSSGGPKSDLDMVRLTFQQFDKAGNGRMESTDLGAFLDLLGMGSSPDRVAEILYELDADGSGFIALPTLEQWYTSATLAPSNGGATASPDSKEAEIEPHDDEGSEHGHSDSD